MEIYHVSPIDDLRPHLTTKYSETGELCWCRPEVQELEDRTLIIHNSMDGREQFETGERKPS